MPVERSVATSSANTSMIANHAMRALATLAVLLWPLAGLASAQQTLTTTFANNNGGGIGGAIYFTMTAGVADVVIADIDFSFNSAAGTTGSVDIYTTPGTHAGNELNMALWTNVATCPIASSSAAGTATNGVLSQPLTIPAGTSVGVAYVAPGLAHAYTTGTAPFPLQYANCGLTLDAGTASNLPFAVALFSPRVVNTAINYTTLGQCPTTEAIGIGCVQRLSSVYELTTLDVFALNNTMAGIDFTNTGGGYLLTVAAGTLQPVNSLDPLATALPGMQDDQVVPVGTLGLEFGTNGWLATGSGNSNVWTCRPFRKACAAEALNLHPKSSCSPTPAEVPARNADDRFPESEGPPSQRRARTRAA